MPTSLPRHSITETPPVREALDALRAETGDERVDYGELVILGAREKMRVLRQDSAAAIAARRRLADMVRAGDTLVDVEAADAAKRHGLIERH